MKKDNPVVVPSTKKKLPEVSRKRSASKLKKEIEPKKPSLKNLNEKPIDKGLSIEIYNTDENEISFQYSPFHNKFEILKTDSKLDSPELVKDKFVKKDTKDQLFITPNKEITTNDIENEEIIIIDTSLQKDERFDLEPVETIEIHNTEFQESSVIDSSRKNEQSVEEKVDSPPKVNISVNKSNVKAAKKVPINNTWNKEPTIHVKATKSAALRKEFIEKQEQQKRDEMAKKIKKRSGSVKKTNNKIQTPKTKTVTNNLDFVKTISPVKPCSSDAKESKFTTSQSKETAPVEVKQLESIVSIDAFKPTYADDVPEKTNILMTSNVETSEKKDVLSSTEYIAHAEIIETVTPAKTVDKDSLENEPIFVPASPIITSPEPPRQMVSNDLEIPLKTPQKSPSNRKIESTIRKSSLSKKSEDFNPNERDQYLITSKSASRRSNSVQNQRRKTSNSPSNISLRSKSRRSTSPNKTSITKKEELFRLRNDQLKMLKEEEEQHKLLKKKKLDELKQTIDIINNRRSTSAKKKSNGMALSMQVENFNKEKKLTQTLEDLVEQLKMIKHMKREVIMEQKRLEDQLKKRESQAMLKSKESEVIKEVKNNESPVKPVTTEQKSLK